MAKKPRATRPTAPAVMSPAPQPTPQPQPPMLQPMLHARCVRFLLICGHSNAHVRQLLESDDLPCPCDPVLDALRSQYTPPPSFQPSNRAHGPSLRFVLGAQVEPFFRRDQRDADAALALLRHPRARELVEAGLIVGVPIEATIPMLATLLSVTTSATAVSLFAFTFFDIDVVSRAQLRVLVQERVRLSVLRAVGGDDAQSAVRRAIAADPRVIAMGLPRGASGWSAVLLSAGWLPPRRELSASLKELEQLAVVRASEALLRGGRDDDRRADGFVTVVGKLRAITANLTDPNESAMKALQQLRIRPSTERMPTMRQLVEAGDQVGTLELGPPTAVESAEEKR